MHHEHGFDGQNLPEMPMEFGLHDNNIGISGDCGVVRQEFDCGRDQVVNRHQHVVKHHHDIINEYDVIHEHEYNYYDVVRHRDVVRHNDFTCHAPEYCERPQRPACCGMSRMPMRRRRF